MKIKIILTLLFSIFLFNFIAATCTVTFDKEVYSQTETVIADMVCTSAAEKSTSYTLNWTYENGTSIELDSSVTPATAGEHFYESYILLSGWPTGVFINATLQGTGLEGTDSANVSGATANSLLISNATIGGKWLGLVSSVQAIVKDKNGKKISGGYCKSSAWSNDESQMLFSGTTALFDGIFKIEGVFDYASFNEGTDYAVLINCFCGSTGSNTECIDEDGSAVTNSIGSTKLAFTTNNWATMLNAPFPITYINGTTFTNPVIYAGFGKKVYFDATVTNNYNGELVIHAKHFLINNVTGGIYSGSKGGTYARATGNSTIIIEYEITKDAPTGVYYVRNIFDIYHNNILVTQGVVSSTTFNITGTDDSFVLSGVYMDKSDYYTGEEVHLCANITNDYDERVEFEILYNYRCGSNNDNFDTDRTILAEHTELRAVSARTSQYQCASLPISFHDHLLHKTSSCYASVTIKSPYIATFDNKKTSTSSVFNVTDYGMFPQYELDSSYPFVRLFSDWRRFDNLIDNVSRNYVRTKINISKLNESYLDPQDTIGDDDWDVYIVLTDKMPSSMEIYNYSVEYANGTAIDNPTENKCLQWGTSQIESHCSIGIENVNFSDPDDDYFIVKVWFEDFDERQTEALENQSSFFSRSATALEGIENKTGTFHLDVSCPSQADAGSDLTCIITAQVEDSQTVEKEVDFTCFILDGSNIYSSINFNQMVNKTSIFITQDFPVPSTFNEGSQYVLQCYADYYNLGSRRDSFYDTFVIGTSTVLGGGSTGIYQLANDTEGNGDEKDSFGIPKITGGAIGVGGDLDGEKGIISFLLEKKGYLIFVLFIFSLGLLFWVKFRKSKKQLSRQKENLDWEQFLRIIFAIVIFGLIILSLLYAYQFVKETLIPQTSFITNTFNFLIQDNFYKVLIFVAFIFFLGIIFLKVLNVQGKIEFGSKRYSFGDKQLTKMQTQLNRMILKDEIKRTKNKNSYRVVKVKRK